ncbi:hypothetical protein BJ165DRAFT_1530879 [Panaeolus papilionaceus]|nr:hypothetical protein BJ165DRAFT_1530879 [Panaeolus papilionaceus]
MGTGLQLALIDPQLGELNLTRLAQSTSAAFDVLSPWYQAEHSCHTLQHISRKTKDYVDALTFSIVAAKGGYALAVDVLALVEDVQASGGLLREPDRVEYLSGMLNLAHKGSEMASQASDKFHAVRATLTQLIDSASQSASRRFYSPAEIATAEENLARLKDGIPILEEFSGSVSLYSAWWNAMHMQATSVEARQELDYNPIRQKTIIKKWEYVQKQYSDYHGEINQVKSKYHTIFANASEYSLPESIERASNTSSDSQSSVISLPLSLVDGIFGRHHRLHHRHRCGFIEDSEHEDPHEHHGAEYYMGRIKHLGHHITHSFPWHHVHN